MSDKKPGFRMLDLDRSDENLIAYELTEGEVTDDELAPYWKRFDEAATDGRRIRIFAVMHALPKFGDGLVVEKLNRVESVKSVVERMAIVGDASWLATYAKTAAPIMDIEIIHFPMADRKAALAWIRN